MHTTHVCLYKPTFWKQLVNGHAVFELNFVLAARLPIEICSTVWKMKTENKFPPRAFSHSRVKLFRSDTQ